MFQIISDFVIQVFFDSYSDLVRHQIGVHNLFKCYFCKFTLSVTDESVVSHHLEASHNVSSPDVDVYAISSDDFGVLANHTKLTSDCRLCHKKLKADKAFNHVMYTHKIKFNTCIEMVRLAGFTLCPAEMEGLPEVPRVTLKRKTKVKKKTKVNVAAKVKMEVKGEYGTLVKKAKKKTAAKIHMVNISFVGKSGMLRQGLFSVIKNFVLKISTSKSRV